jgi:exopolysaccharide biosynthesis protein
LKLLKVLLKISVVLVLVLALCIVTLMYWRPSGLSPISLVITQLAKRDYAWQCAAPLVQRPLNSQGNVIWTKLQCRGAYPWAFSQKSKDTGILTINIVDANLADANTVVKPAIANAQSNPPYRSTLLEQAATYPNAIAGINGGYFRKKPNRRDENCIRRSPKKPLDTPEHIGEGLLVIDQQVYSTNCNGGSLAENGRSTLIQDAMTKQWRIERVEHDVVPANTLNAIGAGPGLIQTIEGKPQIQITWEGILSTLEFSANAAVILAKDKQGEPHMLFFTVDGIDREYGMTSLGMTNFIYNKIPTLFGLQLVSAMSMDQGNSTTLFVKKADQPIVSITGTRGAVRNIYDGLFIIDASQPGR